MSVKSRLSEHPIASAVVIGAAAVAAAYFLRRAGPEVLRYLRMKRM